jgi:putative proteasome-type protease
MTYCLGIKLREGIVAISDTRITSGNETTTAEKYKIYKNEHQSLFIMTSGLRSVRDKAITYFSEALDKKFDHLDKLYQAVNLFGEQIKQVASEDKEALLASGLSYNIHAIVGGRLSSDKVHKLYLLYPEGNWIEVGKGSPFTIIGNSGYGKPVLRRTISYESSIRFALKTGFLSFDSTRVSANDVDYPIDVLICRRDSQQIQVRRFEQKDMESISKMWGELLIRSVNEVPEDWMDVLLERPEFKNI